MGPNRKNEPKAAPAESPWPLPSTWIWSTVQRVGTVRLGRQRSPENESGDHLTKYLRAANITPRGIDVSDVLMMNFEPAERQTYSLRAGDIVLAEASGSPSQVGRAAIWRDEIPACCFQNTVIRFRPHAVTSPYALLAFQYFAEHGMFASAARGIGIQHLGAAKFMRMPFPLPPLAEQERIAEEAQAQIRRIEEAIDSLRSALRRNSEQDAAIMGAAALGELLDLPREAPESRTRDSTTRWPSFADLVSQPLPVGWRWVSVEEAGEVTLGRQRTPEHEVGDNLVPYLRVANVLEGRIDTSDVKVMNFTTEEEKTYRLSPGDILLNEGQSPELVGRAAVYDGEPRRVCFQNTLIRFRAADTLLSEFALLVFRHFLHSGYFTRIARWSTNIAHLGVTRFASMPFPLPPRNDQLRIVKAASDRMLDSARQRVTIESSLERSQLLRAAVLRSAVSGTLVPQSVGDEPAAALLERVGMPEAPPNSRQRTRTAMARPKNDGHPRPRPLHDTLTSLGTIASPERLFEAAGYDRDSTADVEAFYLALRQELRARIRQRRTDEGIRLEVIPNATP